ncbi:hypothetical protein T05_2119 [Trichinella murrelli]|uniref:Uncharacterized protein n=1 Tax=Trichinella murrelli TaxID=144512 RepID=A0A0V0TEQ3_9BILA|nr:hypothetical protein T05_2119 [Trichinella murrelli]
MMAACTSQTINVQIKAGRSANWTIISPLIACNIGSLDAGRACCFCDAVADSKLTAAQLSINKRRLCTDNGCEFLTTRRPLASSTGVVTPRTGWGGLSGFVAETTVIKTCWSWQWKNFWNSDSKRSRRLVKLLMS